MPKEGENLLWDYLKISNEDVSKLYAYFSKRIYQERERTLTK